MKTTKLFLFLAVAVLLGACKSKTQQPEDVLNAALEKVERIKVAGYEIEEKVKAPYEKEWADIRHCRYIEQDNPKDTTIGASVLHYMEDGSLLSAYDGTNSVTFHHEEKRTVVKDFLDTKSLSLPFRPYTPPFYNYVKSLIRYMQNTSDSIHVDVEETEEDYIYKLSIYEDRQVEFFGRAYKMPHNPYDLSEEDAYSYYTLWIRKADTMPYRYLREMSHNINEVTCYNTEWSEDASASNPIVAMDFVRLHGGYKVHYVGKRDTEKDRRCLQQVPDLSGSTEAADDHCSEDLEGVFARDKDGYKRTEKDADENNDRLDEHLLELGKLAALGDIHKRFFMSLVIILHHCSPPLCLSWS